MYLTERFYQFMDAHKLAVISTVNELGLPEAAVVGFGQTPKLEIIFGTNNTSRKYQNIMNDPHVAFVVGWDNGETIQYEGTARELSPKEHGLVDEYYSKKSQESAKHRKNPDNRYFLVTPSWIRYTDLKHKPWDIHELTLSE